MVIQGISKTLLGGLVIIVCILSFRIPAYADGGGSVQSDTDRSALSGVQGETKDTYYDFELQTKTTDGTGYRPKQDATSTYVHAATLGSPCQLFVDAPGDVNCTVNGRAYLNYCGYFAIRQNVHEWGYHRCRLTAWRSGNPTRTTGEWSPDSWRKWPYLNAS